MARPKGEAVVKAIKLEALAITYLPLDHIHPNSYNPNRQSDHDFKLLCRSMKEDGFTQPIVAVPDPEREPDAGGPHVIIVDGEHRWRGAARLTEQGEAGFDPAPVVITPMSLEQARIATLRHNRARGSEDIGLSAQVLRDLRELGALDWALDSLELDELEVTRLLDDIPAPEALAGAEFHQAWEPTRPEDTVAGGTYQVTQQGGAQQVVGRTDSAADKLREREAAIAQAKTAEERTQARRESAGYRLILFFSADEGELVRGVLEPEPAQKVLELCRAAASAASSTAPAGDAAVDVEGAD